MHFASLNPDGTGLAEKEDASVPVLCFSLLKDSELLPILMKRPSFGFGT